jgi:four helix bundle protein
MEEYRTERQNKNRGSMRLIVWQKAVNLFELVWRLAYVELTLDFKLRSQSTDAAQSVSANIAEGYGRRSIKEYSQFLYIALGSLAQTVTRAMGLLQRKQIGKRQFEECDLLYDEVENRLIRLVEKLENKLDDGDWIARLGEDPANYISAS